MRTQQTSEKAQRSAAQQAADRVDEEDARRERREVDGERERHEIENGDDRHEEEQECVEPEPRPSRARRWRRAERGVGRAAELRHTRSGTVHGGRSCWVLVARPVEECAGLAR